MHTKLYLAKTLTNAARNLTAKQLPQNCDFKANINPILNL